jgi:hypothetical protein
VDGPSQLGEFFFDVRKCDGESGTSMRTRRALGENALALQLQRLSLTFAFSGLGVVVFSCGFWSRCLRLLFFHGFALPSSRHTFILRSAVLQFEKNDIARHFCL